MKNITLSLFVLSSAVASAQLPVSTVAGKKQSIVEEFTGHQCQYCPDGHKTVDGLITANPTKVFGVNVHTGSYAGLGGSYVKDFRTTDGDAIAAIPGQSIAGYPAGTVNRAPCANPQTAGGMAMSRNYFGAATAAIYAVNSYVNIAGQANFDPATSIFTINIEVYYTANGPSTPNKLSVMLVQDKIMGPQSGGSTWYPAMMVGSNYTHNKALRDVLTTGATGETLSGANTMGSKITKTITYTMPATIKNIATVIADMRLIAFVSETDKNIMAVCGAPITQGATEVQELSAMISNLNVYPNPAASNTNVEFKISEPTNTSVVISNMVGQAVYTEELGKLAAGDHSFPLNSANLQNGLYLVSIITGSNKMTTTVSIDK